MALFFKIVSNTIVSHVNSNESNHLKTSMIDYVKITSNVTYFVVQNNSLSNALIALQNIIDTESSIFINDKTMFLNNINE